MLRISFVEAPMVLAYLLVFIVSSQSNITIPLSFEYSDKILHFLTFFVLTILTLRTAYYRLYWEKKHKIIIFLIVIFYAMTDEVHQLFVPGRVFDYWDWLADFFGSVTGVLVSQKILTFEEKISLHFGINLKIK